MNKLRALLATAMTSLMLGCASPGFAQDFMENPKFLRRMEPVLGLNVQELRTVLGTPREIQLGECIIPFQPNESKPPIPIIGHAWVYSNKTNTTSSMMVFCVVDNHAVAELRTLQMTEGSRIYTSEQLILDTDLLEKAFKGELDESSYEERTIPRIYNGPEYEI